MTENGAGVIHVESGPIGRTLLHFAVPVLLSQFLQEFYNIADCAVIGRFGGSFSLAAAGSSGLLMSVMINFFVGFSSGVSVITANLFGARHYEDLKRVICSVTRLSLLAGTVMTAVVFILADRILGLLRCPSDVLPHASVYIHLCILGLTAQLIYNVGTAVLRSLGDTRTPLYLFLLSSVANLILDLVLVAGLSMGIRGAALATLFSQWLLAALILDRMFRMDSAYALALKGRHLKTCELLRILHMGIPAGLQALFMSLSSILIQVFINGFGADAIAGMVVYAKLEGFLYLPSFSFGIALTGFVGQNCGAHCFDRIRSSVRLSLQTMCAAMVPLALLLAGIAPAALRLFTSDVNIIANALEAVRITFPVYVFYAVNQVLLGVVKGLGNTTWPMICTLLCYSLFRVAWCYILIPVFPTMRVVYLSYDVSFFLMFILLLPKYRKLLYLCEDGDNTKRKAKHY